MSVINEGALYSNQSKLSVVFYLRACSIQGNTVYASNNGGGKVVGKFLTPTGLVGPLLYLVTHNDSYKDSLINNSMWLGLFAEWVQYSNCYLLCARQFASCLNSAYK